MFRLIKRIILFIIIPLLLAGFFTNYRIELVNPLNHNIIFVSSGNAKSYLNSVKNFFKRKSNDSEIDNIPLGNLYSLNGIRIFKTVTNKRHFATDGYCYGKIGQCVEFVKRYYHDHLQHSFPNEWGHAKSFYDPNLPDGAFNADRALYQFKNGNVKQPKLNDIIIFNKSYYGHVAIVSEVTDNYIVIKQQNCRKPTKRIALSYVNNRWEIEDSSCVAFLSLTK